MTSAPRSARFWPAQGPASTRERSRTRMCERGPTSCVSAVAFSSKEPQFTPDDPAYRAMAAEISRRLRDGAPNARAPAGAHPGIVARGGRPQRKQRKAGGRLRARLRLRKPRGAGGLPSPPGPHGDPRGGRSAGGRALDLGLPDADEHPYGEEVEQQRKDRAQPL